MKQIKKKLYALALGLLGVITMNAQTNLVKNGTFRVGNTSKGTTQYWELNSGSTGELAVENGSKSGDAFSLVVKSTVPGDYVYQRITGINATNFKLSFAVKGYWDYVNVKLVWSTGKEEEVFNYSKFMQKLVTDYPAEYQKYDSYYYWYPKDGHPETDIKILGEVPQDATWVEIRFVDGGDIDGAGTSPFEAFYVDDVVFETSGVPIPPDPLEAPQNLKIENVTTQSVKLTWDSVANAEGYVINVNGQTHTVTTNFYDVTGLSEGTKYSAEVKGYSDKTKKIVNKEKTIEFFTLGNEKPDGDNIFFKGGTFKNGDADLNKGWINIPEVSTTDENIDGNVSTKMRIQNGVLATVARSNDFSVESGKKYTVSAMAKAPTKEEDKALTFNIIWKKADGSRILTTTVGKTVGDAWGTIINEVTAPNDAVVAEIQFQLPGGQDANSIFYVDDVQVIKGEVAPTDFKVSEVNQRNVTLSWGAVKGKSYKVTVNGKTLDANDNMVRVNGLVPNTEYTAEVYSTDADTKKSTVKFKTKDFVQTEENRIAYLSNIDESGVIPQEFFYNISELDGDAIKTIEFVYNELPIQENVPGKISLPATEGKKLVVKITQENGNQTTLTYYVVTFKK